MRGRENEKIIFTAPLLIQIKGIVFLLFYSCFFVTMKLGMSNIILYDRDASMEKNEIYDYVISHIDDAIANEWIKVYYQPVVRSLTRQLCGAESLARWIDPEVGFFPPDKFIGALEDSKNIHKLDCFIVEKVCKDIHYRLEKRLPAIPVSVNFSRLDFIMCDMLALIEGLMDKYDVPRDFIHIEITESMIVQDEELMTDIIGEFRNRGYEVWMDDFGSGFSSLTLLKDYEFDLLKLDMRFLSTMNDKSKAILRSTVGMAKRIGMKTLSEGVETEEQIEFLTRIGCGKLQGYYFGKPMPLQEMLDHLEKREITIEERKWRSYYETACFAVLDTENPYQILEYDGNNFTTLFMNTAYKQQIGFNFEDTKFIDSIIYNPTSPNMPKLKNFAERAIKSKSKESLYLTDKGSYLLLKAVYLTDNEGKYLFKSTISNISLDQNTNERDKLDSRLRELNSLYEVVHLVNYKENVVVPLLGGYNYVDEVSATEVPFDESTANFSEKYVYPDDRKAFNTFINLESLNARMKAEGRGFIRGTFRVKQKDGSYKWREMAILVVPGTGGNEFLFTISLVSPYIAKALDEVVYSTNYVEAKETDAVTREYALLWENLLNISLTKMFWKDRDRRFRGVSRSFLEFYEIKSLDDIIGKNDEEMHWHVDDGPYQGDELDVIGKGKVVFNARGQCIVNGVVHNIICNKMPIYDKGEIVGLLGSFADVDQELYRVQKLLNPSRLDNITRLMNSKCFMETMIDYAIQFNDSGKKYGLIMLHNASHQRIEEAFGSKFSSKVLREIGEKIIDVIGQRGVAARVKEAYFAVLIYIDSAEKLKALATELKEHIEEINRVGGNSVTIKMTTIYHMRTDEGITDESIYSQTLKEIQKKES